MIIIVIELININIITRHNKNKIKNSNRINKYINIIMRHKFLRIHSLWGNVAKPTSFTHVRNSQGSVNWYTMLELTATRNYIASSSV